jgi:hypothetical protein
MAVMAEAARAQRIKKELEALEDQATTERVALPWKDLPGQTFPVINLALDVVVLNHRSHRIKAQLASEPKRKAVEDDPFSEFGQGIISDLLRHIDGYEDLKANLGEVGQHDPGVVTRKGVLINANTRAVALRELGKEYIRVAVLPANADAGDLAKLELALQMRRDFKQEYTFTNQLLFVEDLRAVYGYDDEKVAKAMNLAASSDAAELKRGAKQAASFTRMLAVIKDLQNRSGDRIPYAFFDDKRQALIDLDQRYEDHNHRDPEGALRMKEARLAAILTGSFYRDIRLIDEGTAVERVVPAIEQNPEIGGELAAVIEVTSGSATVPAGISDLGDDVNSAPKGPGLAPLVDMIASSYGQNEILLTSAAGVPARRIERDEFLRHVGESIGDAVEEIRNAARAAKTLSDPIKLVNDAKAQADKALDAYRKVATTPGFKISGLESPVRSLKHAVEALEREIAKHKPA